MTPVTPVRKLETIVSVCITSGLLIACSGEAFVETDTEDQLGELRAAIALPDESVHDVASIRIRIVSGSDCDGDIVAESTVSLESEGLPEPLTEEGAGAGHRFGDGLFLLPPGRYSACATPLDADLEPSRVCASVKKSVRVRAEQTTEVILISRCEAPERGGLDVVLALNTEPYFTSIEISESKYITVCERATIRVSAEDPDGDTLSYEWGITSAPSGANPTLGVEGDRAEFSADVAGDYQLSVSVSDSYGESQSLLFPIHVSADCGAAAPSCPPGTRPLEADTGTTGDPNTLSCIACEAEEDAPACP